MDTSQEPEEVEGQAEPQKPEVFAVIKGLDAYHLSRRKFIRGSVAAAAAAAATTAAGCTSPGAPATPSKAAAVPTIRPSSTPPPTATQRPTDTPTIPPPPTQTPVPTATTFVIQARVRANSVNFRSGPGTMYPPITKLDADTEVTLTGRLEDGSWVQVRFVNPGDPSGSISGWIKTDLIDPQGQNIDLLPVVNDIPPTPTPLPGRQGTTYAGDKGIDYQVKDSYGNVYNYTLPCGSPIPEGAVCVCNCVTVPAGPACTCDTHGTSRCTCDQVCTCDTVHYWYPN
jgi:hypothetical protein